MRYSSAATWAPTAAIGFSCLILGIGVSSATFAQIESSKSAEQRATITKLKGQITALHSTIRAQATALSAPLDAPPTPTPSTAVTAPAITAPTALPTTAPPPSPPMQTKPPATKPAPVVQPPQKSTATTTPHVQPPPAQKPEERVAPQTKLAEANPPTQVATEEIKAAEKNAIELAPAAKVGVDRVDRDGVLMRSGLRVRIGDRFSSGEKLLTVDIDAAKIVTNRRTIMLLN